jgi:succinyl-diaminopimelate desuccinylase
VLLPDVAQLASEMVRIDSVNPGPAGEAVAGPREADISRFVADWLRERAIAVERREFVPGRFNVSAVVPGTGSRRLLLDAHTDTVPTEGMEGEPLSGEVRDGKVYGRGACDDKGTLAAAMCALADLVADGLQPPATIELLASGDEEGGFKGIRDWVAHGRRADGAIVGEASELQLIAASKGALRCKIRTRGESVHTSVPEHGVNAVVHMARVVCALEDRLKPRLTAHQHPLLGTPRLTVAMIEGGRRANIVPDECIIDIDRRVLPGETRESVLAEIDAVLAEVAATDPSLRIERAEPYGFVPAPECPLDDPLLLTAARALEREGLSGEPHGVPYTTHASVLAEAGVPCITIGPGSIDQAHSPNEWVEVSQLETAVRIYRRIFETFGSDNG